VGKKRWFSLVLVSAALPLSGFAAALWQVSGSTTAEARASEARLEATGGAASDLYPGGYQPATISVRNTNSYPVQFGQFSITNVTVDPDHPSCPGQVVRLDPATTGHSTTLLPGELRDFQVGVGLDPAAPQECVEAVFTITYHAAGSVG
jgi:hypothetical protein